MGYNARNDEIRDNVTRMQREPLRRFNAVGSGRAERASPSEHAPANLKFFSTHGLPIGSKRRCAG